MASDGQNNSLGEMYECALLRASGIYDGRVKRIRRIIRITPSVRKSYGLAGIDYQGTTELHIVPAWQDSLKKS